MAASASMRDFGFSPAFKAFNSDKPIRRTAGTLYATVGRAWRDGSGPVSTADRPRCQRARSGHQPLQPGMELDASGHLLKLVADLRKLARGQWRLAVNSGKFVDEGFINGQQPLQSLMARLTRQAAKAGERTSAAFHRFGLVAPEAGRQTSPHVLFRSMEDGVFDNAFQDYIPYTDGTRYGVVTGFTTSVGPALCRRWTRTVAKSLHNCREAMPFRMLLDSAALFRINLP